MKKRYFLLFSIVVVLSALLANYAFAQNPDEPEGINPGPTSVNLLGTAISYQGQLIANNQSVNGKCDFRFSLWDAITGSSQIGSTIKSANVTVDKGMFMVDNLDFGSEAFNGDPRWLQIEVRCPAGEGAYTSLSPRTAILATPYALYSGNSDKLDGLEGADFYPSSGGDLWGRVKFKDVLFGDWQIGSDGIFVLEPPLLRQWFSISDPDDASQPIRLMIDKITGDVGIAKNLGIGTDQPEARLHVVGKSYFNGIADFKLNQGTISMSTPGGWPGIIAFAPNGHRREIVVRDDAIAILASNSSSPSPNDAGITIPESGFVGIGTWNPQARLDVAGTARAQVLQITGGGDLAEPFDIQGAENVLPGMVVAIDPDHPGQLRIAQGAYDRTVAGCVSGANGIQPGLTMQQEGSPADGDFPVALSGRVYCWADAAYGAIHPGDLLTTSDTPGHLMVVEDYESAQGAIVGKAMEALERGQALILILVTLQ